jgi:3-dehydroquinate synthase II
LKEFWLKIDENLPQKNREALIKSSSQYCNIFLIENDELISLTKENKIKVCSKDESSDIFLIDEFDENKILELKKSGKKIAIKITIKKRKDEEFISKALDLLSDYILLNCPDWKIIPLENIIAKAHGKCKLLAKVSSSKEADIALKTLEIGADGIVLETSRIEEIIETSSLIKRSTLKIEISEAEIIGTKPIGMGARVCIDTVDLMKKGEGMLVGSQSSGLFLVESETHESSFVETRPFRVNAGPVSLYILVSPEKTNYLSELKAGDEVMIVDRTGKARVTNIGRVKIEWRPMVLVEAKTRLSIFRTILQNAETIRLVTSEGSKSVTELKKGDKILVRLEEGGRHFGVKVEKETVIER